ncbi:MAG: diaminopimelate decarboxylase [Pseudomonadota bacterium]
MTLESSILPEAFGRDAEGQLHCEGVRLSSLAQAHGTPLYVYSARAIRQAYRAFAAAASDEQPLSVCYAVKANPTLGILKLLAREGAGFDIVSEGELFRVLKAGGQASQCVFSGVGKRDQELAEALRAGVGCINVESIDELRQLSAVASAMGQRAPISIRVNPDIDPKTHPYISTGLKENKFGVPIEEALDAYRLAHALPGLEIHGVDCHIGSQITSLPPFLEATERVLAFVDTLAAEGIHIAHIDLGGGLGIRYHDEQPPSATDLLEAVKACVAHWSKGRQQPVPRLVFEFGRAIVGQAGVLLTQVCFLKPGSSKNFAIVDAGMNDLMRPALYEAWHEVFPVLHHTDAPTLQWDVVGPVCESGDWLARDRALSLLRGDLLVLASAGAYGSSMASNYNSRPRPAEVLIEEAGEVQVIRARERLDDLIRGEPV